MTTVRPRKCRHANVTGRGWADSRWYVEAASTKNCPSASALVCQDCGEWLPLGPARDTPETAIELRAAELALLYVERKSDPPFQWCTIFEWLGLEDDRPPIDNDEYRAGYLARCIGEGE